MHLVGAAGSNPEGSSRLPGVSNYMNGSDQSKWQRGVPSFGSVVYRSVYPGTDWVFHTGDDGAVEYDFALAPGSDPSRIAMAFAGADGAHVDSNGDLVLSTAAGDLRQHKPNLYQVVNGARQPVDGGYRAIDAATIGFTVGSYDHRLPLVIDPTLVYSSYLSGANSTTGFQDMNWISAVAADSAGNAYVAGQTRSASFPTTTGAYQTTASAFQVATVSKISPDGSSLVWSTYLGTGGGDMAYDLALDGSGHAFVTGQAGTGFPTTPGAYATTGSGFVTEFTPDGSGLVYSTLLPDGQGSIALDRRGNAYTVEVGCSGRTVTKLNPTGTALAYSLAVPSNTGICLGPHSIAVDRSGSAYVVVPNRSTSTLSDVVKVRPDGSGEAYRFALGDPTASRGLQQAMGIAVDASGNAYVTGVTPSGGFPTTPGAFQTKCADCVVYDDGVTTAGSTTFTSESATFKPGETADVGGYICTATQCFNIVAVVDEHTVTLDNPATDSATGLTFNVGSNVRCPEGYCQWVGNAFVSKVNPAGTGLVYSTFLGGFGPSDGDNFMLTGDASIQNPQGGIAIDSSGNAYVTGMTTATDFPTKDPVAALANTSSLDSYENHDFLRSNAFATELGPSGSSLVYSTTLGGSGADVGMGIAIDGTGNTYVVGSTGASEFPTTPGSFQPRYPGGEPPTGFVAKIAPTAQTVPFLASPGPAAGPDAGGTSVVLAGHGLAGATSVKFGATPATSFVVNSDVQITAISPPHNAGTLSDSSVIITVTTPSGTTPANPISRFVYGQGRWTETGPMGAARRDPTATTLRDGRVLVAGGRDLSDVPYTSSELYDPVANTWSATGDLTTARGRPAATLLRNGKVLALGGGTATAELYDPATGTWTATSSPMANDHDTATLLPDGKVLAVGVNDPAELYDPATDSWSATGTTTTPRNHAKATLLDSGKVLVVGGYGSSDSAELYDPASGTWTATASMATGRIDPTATLLADGRVLVTGGLGDLGGLTSMELYDPVAGTWSSAGNTQIGRHGSAAARLINGDPLIAGGQWATRLYGGLDRNPSTATAELYDPLTPSVPESAGLMTHERGPTGGGKVVSAQLQNGNVLVLAASGDKSAEVYTNGSKAAQVANFDRDSQADISVFRPASGTWYAHQSSGGDTAVGYGASGDIAVQADYDGDGRSDIAIYRPSTGLWAIHRSTDGANVLVTYGGIGGDIPVPGDYDGDGRADIAIYRPSVGTWYVHRSSDNTDTAITYGGVSGDIPVPADYDGDGTTDVAIFRPSGGAWYVHPSDGAADTAVSYGQSGDIPVAGDYDGDGRTDIAIFRPGTGLWALHRTTGTDAFLTYGGIGGDVPVPADYDGDGKADVTIFRPSLGLWYEHRSSDGSDVPTTFGVGGDVPLPLAPAVRSAFF
jgi:hypothetical protein